MSYLHLPRSTGNVHMIRILLPALLVFLFPPVASAQDTTNYPVLGEILRFDPALDELIPKDARIEVLGSGFVWAEGPVWVADDQGGSLLFSDIPRNSVM